MNRFTLNNIDEEQLKTKNRFLTTDMQENIDYLIGDVHTRKLVYYECELYLRAKYKLKTTGLSGSKQAYASRLKTILTNILRTSSLIEAPIEYRFPAPESAILDILIISLQQLVDDKNNVEYIVSILLDINSFKLRKTSEAYYKHMDDLYPDEDEDPNSYSGCKITPDGGYEIGYTLLPCSDEFIIDRIAEDFDISTYMNHPLFYTNGI